MLKISSVTVTLVEAIVEALTLIKGVGKKLIFFLIFDQCEVGIIFD